MLRSSLPDPNANARVFFLMVPGQYTYTSQALQGSSVLSTIGSIPLTAAANFPLSIPLISAFGSFDHYQTDVGLVTPNNLLFFGTPDRDRIVQYGGAANDLLSVEMGDGDDWGEQYGGGGDDAMDAAAGSGNDYIYQEGGAGNDNLTGSGGNDNDWFSQKGGTGGDKLNCLGSNGNDHIYQEGGSGNDTIRVNGGDGDDSVTIDAGPGDDTITYDVSIGTDNASVDGGDGNDFLIVDQNGLPVLIQDPTGQVIYQFGSGGTTTITVTNVEHLTVNDSNGNPVFTWP